MNVDDGNININKVTSKYFTKGHMDDSLTDFKETKKISTGPKISKAITKKKQKSTKRIKGQKDIRVALNKKKDELFAYTKQFDVYCRKSGIDVDPEQLQIAIALSKSLQTEPLNDDCKPNTNISTQEKAKRIRNTLQEYGFKIRKNKITSKKIKKAHSNYKLLTCTNTQKLEVISDRFAQVLLQNVCHFKTNSTIDFSKAPLYYISTNISYKEVKNDEIFYVDGLIDKSKSIGGLLKNWSDIPGRPVSPICIEYFKMNFNDIECSQDELDLALSGSFKSIKNIIISKQNDNSDRNICTSYTENKFENTEQDNCLKMDMSNRVNNDVGSQVSQNKYRSCSPDIFEDEISIVASDKNNESVCENKIRYVMDLTECVNVDTDIATSMVDIEGNRNIVNKSYISRRKSDDIMEITECVASTSKLNNQFDQNYEIDLTQSSHNVHTRTRDSTTTGNRSDNDDIDLTQSSDSSNELPVVQFPKNHSLDDTIIINTCDYENIIKKRKVIQSIDNGGLVDLTQDCKETEVNEGNSSQSSLFDDYVYGHSDHSEGHTENEKHHGSAENRISEDTCITKILDSSNEMYYRKVHESLRDTDDNGSNCNNKISIILNQSKLDEQISCGTVGKNIISEKLKTSLNEINECKVMNSKSSKSRQELVLEYEQSKNNDNEVQSSCTNFRNYTHEVEDKIDLTQETFDIGDGVNISALKTYNSSLVNKYKVPIDQEDEISSERKHYSPVNGLSSSESIVFDKTTNYSENNNSLELSQHSEVFEIIDYELNYSLHQSRHEHCNAAAAGAATSTINDFSIAQQYCAVIDLDHKGEITNDLDNLPDVDIKGMRELLVTPTRAENENVNRFESPQNSEFIIKTREVTPMKDYVSMSTPERNKELDKYGIKPFKRKRAIQLLTHIYNQTHPVVECSVDCVQSPAKKTKQNASPRNPTEKLKSPKKNNYFENNGNIYEVTSEVPAVGEFECAVEDWVFQKREKAKVHSCRVPLHVAFHNYVSCRRGLREAILRYEPVNIDVIHKELVGYGHRYDPKDLLRFMDKKCITVKTTDNNGRNY